MLLFVNNIVSVDALLLLFRLTIVIQNSNYCIDSSNAVVVAVVAVVIQHSNYQQLLLLLLLL